jgi:hypothetical protein
MLMQGLPQLPDTADELKAIARRRSLGKVVPLHIWRPLQCPATGNVSAG